jgi:hypothetical protein
VDFRHFRLIRTHQVIHNIIVHVLKQLERNFFAKLFEVLFFTSVKKKNRSINTHIVANSKPLKKKQKSCCQESRSDDDRKQICLTNCIDFVGPPTKSDSFTFLDWTILKIKTVITYLCVKVKFYLDP